MPPDPGTTLEVRASGTQPFAPMVQVRQLDL